MAIKNYGIHTLRSGDSFVPFISIVKCIYLKCYIFLSKWSNMFVETWHKYDQNKCQIYQSTNILRPKGNVLHSYCLATIFDGSRMVSQRREAAPGSLNIYCLAWQLFSMDAGCRILSQRVGNGVWPEERSSGRQFKCSSSRKEGGGSSVAIH